MKIKLHTLIKDLSSAAYHSVKGTHSSSQLKDLEEDPQIFYKKWILKEIPRLESEAFDLGTYVHSGILERHNLLKDCAVYPGKIRRGKEWEAFKLRNKGKAIVTQSAMEHAEMLIKCVQNSPIAMGRIRKGTAEVSIFVKIAVYNGNIYAVKHEWRLESTGWAEISYDEKINWDVILRDGTILIIKVRADSLGKDWILDVKTTTGNAKSKKAMRSKVSYYGYDLSAALYLDMFSAGTGRFFKEFIWTFVSKDMYNTRSYRASRKNILVGRKKWSKAVLKLAAGIETKWDDIDFLDVLDPEFHELQHLSESAEDLL